VKKPHFKHEQEWQGRGKLRVAGVDEVGRGPLAGPVYAAAVILDPARLKELKGLNDSKKMTPEKREDLFPRIQACALAWAVGWADEKEIDRHNILQASFLAMRRALDKLDPPPDLVLVDGSQSPGRERHYVTLIGGDGISLSIAAASVLAKVSRDRVMLELHERFPAYGFDRHKGYATSTHLKALREYGPCEVHRRSFLSNQIDLPLEGKG
jgi:ribonuclease HII